MLRRSITLLVWALVAWVGVSLALRLGGAGAPVHAPEALPALAATPSLARLLGAPALAAPEIAAPTDGRLRLLGVVAPGDERTAGGVALLSIDGGPPKAYRVGEQVDGNLVLMRVTARSAVLGEAGVARQELSLQNAAPAAAAVGSLPPTPVMTPTLTQTLPGVAAEPGVAVPSLPLRQGPAPGPAALPQTPVDAVEASEEAGPRRPVPPPAR